MKINRFFFHHPRKRMFITISAMILHNNWSEIEKNFGSGFYCSVIIFYLGNCFVKKNDSAEAFVSLKVGVEEVGGG